MKNLKPILLNCFSRGGSNILWNFLLSHPQACSPIEETLQIFRWDWRAPRRAGLQAIWHTRQPRFFDQWNLAPRQPLRPPAQRFIDQTLFEWKLKTLQDKEMRWKSQSETYAADEVANARLVLKNNNGLIFLTEQFLAMYPDATFFGLTRDPAPLYESHKRRRTPAGVSPQAFANFYNRMINQMQADAARWAQYKILRFEDLLHEPIRYANEIYRHAGLDMAEISQLRFKAKPHMQANGSHATAFEEGRHYWFNFDEVQKMLEPEVNSYQSSKLDAREKEQVRSLTRAAREALGY